MTYFSPISRALALLLVVALIAPTALLSLPAKADAAGGASCVGGVLGGVAAKFGSDALNSAGASIGLPSAVPVNDSNNLAANSLTSAATVGTCINDLVIVPLARAAIRAILMQMTASVVSFITGKGGGANSAQFVTNIQGNLQRVGDAEAQAFFVRFSQGINSPFTASITSTLQNNYYQQTSLAGYFAANKDTLPQYSSNPKAFLNNDWSAGGTKAWFALATQDNNNPYAKSYAAQSQLNQIVGSATEARKQELNWGQGFLSWCGTDQQATAADAEDAALGAAMRANDPSLSPNTKTQNAAFGSYTFNSSAHNVGDACTNTDGTAGTIKTPSSIIHDYTQKAVVASGFDQLISANDLDNSLGVIMGALLSTALGSVTGLLGASSQTSTGRPSLTTQLKTYQPSSVTASQTSYGSADSILNQVNAYTTAWSTVKSAADAASSSLNHLASVCTAEAASANSLDSSSVNTAALQSGATNEAQVAMTVLSTTVAPVIAQANAQIATVADTQAFALKVQAESVAAPTADSSTQLAADIATLVKMPPSPIDVQNAQANATITNNAAASPTGSLTVSGGTILDQLNLIQINAKALEGSACSAAAYPAGRGSSTNDG